MLYNHRAPYWTDPEDALLEQLWTEGLSAGLIAEQFHNRSRNSIISRAHRLGLPGRPPVVVKARFHCVTPDRTPVPLPVYRDPCVRCGVRGDIGCQHRMAA